MFIAGGEDHLWIAHDDAKAAVLFHRDLTGTFDLGRTVASGVAMLATDEVGAAFIFFQDGAVSECAPDEISAAPQRNFPGGGAPLAVCGAADGVYALAPADVAAGMPWDEPQRCPTSQPEDQDAVWSAAVRWDGVSRTVRNPLCIVRYDHREWRGLTACPPIRPGADPPVGLLVTDERWMVFYYDESTSELRAFERRARGDEWKTQRVAARERPRAFWPILVGGVPTVAVAIPDDAGADELRVFRRLGDAGASVWKESAPNRAPLADGAAARLCESAAGFNQHIALLVRDEEGNRHLQFAAIVGEPSEPSVPLASVFAAPAQVQQVQWTYQFASFLVLFALLVGLFVFRRDAMINPVITPPGMSVALFTQRIIAWLIDLLPFLYAASWFLDVPFGSAVRQLGAWGLGPRSDQHPPEADLVLWWSLGCGGHALYCLVMELLTGRTVGKVLARTVVLSEHGAPPRAAQVFVRNAFRVLELMPQFWVFGLLVMLSRNRQRLGDIFARTYVARRAPRLTMRIDLDAPKSPPDNADPGDSESESNDDEAPRRGE